MKAKFGALITSGSGKLGGHMFSQTPNGVIMKSVGSYSKKATAIQTIKRINTKILMALWSQISYVQRSEWDISAKDYRRIDVFSEVRTFNGFQLFQKVNQNRVQLGLAPILNPGPAHLPTFPTPVTVYAMTDALVLLSQAYNTDDIILVYATNSLGNGITSVKKRMRFITALTDVQLASGVNIIADYLKVFSNPNLNDNIHIGVKTVSSISYFSNKLLYSSSANVSVPVVQTPFFRIRGGSTDYTSTNGGLVWRGGASGPGWSYTGGTYYTGQPITYEPLPAYISVADRVPLFQMERYGTGTLTVNAPIGYYAMRFYFAEAQPGTIPVGARIFNVSVNGVLALQNLDPVALFGLRNLGYVEYIFFNANAQIIVQLQAVVSNPVFRAIELITLSD